MDSDVWLHAVLPLHLVFETVRMATERLASSRVGSMSAHPSIDELGELMEQGYEIEIRPDGSVKADKRPVEAEEILTFRTSMPDSY